MLGNALGLKGPRLRRDGMDPETVIGRYSLYYQVASGGMATVYLGRMAGAAGFGKTVAVKRMHPHLAQDELVQAMFRDEAHIAARIRHPNVVPILDVVQSGKELLLVMEYVQGESLSYLMRSARSPMPPAVVVATAYGVLQGLHAAHEATDDQGRPLMLVHRDVSPQNVMLGQDGVPRVLDFGIAKAVGRLQTTRDGHVKGKASYMAPEQLRGGEVDRRADVYATGIILWELLTGARLFAGDSPESTMTQVLEKEVPPPSNLARGIPPELDDVVLRALSRDWNRRYATAREMAIALERTVTPATVREVGEWVEAVAGPSLVTRARHVADVESRSIPRATLPTVDEVAVASEGHPSSRSRAPSPWLVAGISILLAIGASVTVLIRASRSAAVAPLGVAPPIERSAHAEPPPEPPVASGAVPFLPMPSASSASVPSTPAVSTGSIRPQARVTRAVKPASQPSNNCNPPFTIDERKIKIPKPDCI
jgi:serine/threonine protein kinase